MEETESGKMMKSMVEMMKSQKEQSDAQIKAQKEQTEAQIKAQKEQMETQLEVQKQQNDLLKTQLEKQNERMEKQHETIQTLLSDRTENTRSETSEGRVHKGPSIDSLEKQIRNFSYNPEDGVTFDVWMIRHRDVFENDLKEMDDGDKVRVLLRHVDDKVYRQFTDHIRPKKASDLEFSEIVTTMHELFGDKKSVFEKRLDVFNLKMSKLRHSDIKEFSSCVNRVVEEADIKDMGLEQFKAMVLLASIDLPRYTSTMFHVMNQIRSDEKPTIQSILDVVDVYKEVYGDAHLVANQSNLQVNAVRNNGRYRDQRTEEVQSELTKRCRGCDRYHKRSQCPHSKSICFKCNQIGHLSSQYKNDDESPEERGGQTLKINVIEFVSAMRNPSFDVGLLLNGRSITMMADTGSDLTLISEESWRKIGKPHREKTNDRAVCTNGRKLSLRGVCHINLELNGVETRSAVYVTESKLNVLGKDNFRKFFQLIPRSVETSSRDKPRAPRLTKNRKNLSESSGLCEVRRVDLMAKRASTDFTEELSTRAVGQEMAPQEVTRALEHACSWSDELSLPQCSKNLESDGLAALPVDQKSQGIMGKNDVFAILSVESVIRDSMTENDVFAVLPEDKKPQDITIENDGFAVLCEEETAIQDILRKNDAFAVLSEKSVKTRFSTGYQEQGSTLGEEIATRDTEIQNDAQFSSDYQEQGSTLSEEIAPQDTTIENDGISVLSEEKQFLTGLSRFLYWFASFVSDCWTFAIYYIAMIVFCLIFGLLKNELLYLTPLFLLCSLISLVKIYIIQRIFTSKMKAENFVSLILIIEYIGLAVIFTMNHFSFKTPDKWAVFDIKFDYPYLLDPHVTIMALKYGAILDVSTVYFILLAQLAVFFLLFCFFECGPLIRGIERCFTPSLPRGIGNGTAASSQKSSLNKENLVLEVDNLVKRYGNKNIAVKGVSFGVEEHECFGLLGVNGAGKTSTFEVLTGNATATAGTATVAGVDCATPARIGYCPQFDALMEEMSGRQNLLILAALHGYSNPASVTDTVIECVGMTAHANKTSKSYSGGQRRKISVAGALLAQNSLIILDEPTAGIDPVTRRDIWSVICALRDSTRTAIVLTSHSMDEVEALCSRVAIMKAGLIAAEGSSQTLKSRFGNYFKLSLVVPLESIERVTTAVKELFPKANQLNGSTSTFNYEIPREPGMLWSEMFSSAIKVAKTLNAKDYCLSQASLEDAFIAIAAGVEEQQ